MAEAFWVENVREERDQETGEITEYGDFHFENGKIIKEKKEGIRVNSVSISAPVSEDSNAGTFESMIPDETALSADTLVEYTKMMGKLSEGLTESELDMFEARIFDDCTYEQIGELFGIKTREGARQHVEKVLVKARKICTK